MKNNFLKRVNESEFEAFIQNLEIDYAKSKIYSPI